MWFESFGLDLKNSNETCFNEEKIQCFVLKKRIQRSRQADGYKLTVTGYSGNAGNSLNY